MFTHLMIETSIGPPTLGVLLSMIINPLVLEVDLLNFGMKKTPSLVVKAQVYLDQWKPIIPTEVHEFEMYGNGFLVDDTKLFL